MNTKSDMGINGSIIVILWICLLGLTPAKVILRGEWKENLGWHVICAWQIQLNDSLHSVRMYRNDAQFVVYKLAEDGRSKNASQKTGPASDAFSMKWHCLSKDIRNGRCVAEWEPYENVYEDTYRCEVSGERPTFLWEEQHYTLHAPPTAAKLNRVQFERDTNHRVVNCTSSGVPPPKLVWTVDGQKIPEEFTHTVWNSTTKLWDSWSSFNPQDPNAIALCTPVAVTKFGERSEGIPAQWPDLNNSLSHVAEKYVIVIFSLLALLFR